MTENLARLTKEQANALLDTITTPEEMRALIRRIDVNTEGSVTMLYSGILGSRPGQPSKVITAVDVVNSFARNQEDVRLISGSEIARFLAIDKSMPNRNDPLILALERIFNQESLTEDAIDEFFNGEIVDGVRIPNGIWDEVSARFVDETVGEIVTLTGGALPGRVFAQTELPAILRSKTITHVDGIPIDILKAMGPERAFKAIAAQSETRSAELRIAVDQAGNAIWKDGHVVVDARRFLSHTLTTIGKDPPAELAHAMQWVGEMIPDERILNHAEGITLLREAEVELKRQIAAEDLLDPLPSNRIALRNLARFGMAADVLDLAIVALKAKAAFQAGERLKAQKLIQDWALQNVSSFVTGRTAAIVLSPLLGAGPAGWALYGGLVLGASIGGGILGQKLSDWLNGYLDPRNDPFLTDWLDRTAFRSPLILDLDGDGVETLSMIDKVIYFDHDSSGFAERTGWVSPDDGLLARDLNQDGQITSGRELFGDATIEPTSNETSTGFLALVAMNGEYDQRIDALDPAFSSLFVWRDINSNARLDPGESLSLDELGITSISLISQPTHLIDAQGNLHLESGTYLRRDGSSASMVDVWFKTDRVDTTYQYTRSIPDSIASLPNLPGIGNVYSLHHAMAADSSGQLQRVVERWVKGSVSERDLLLPELLHRWAGVFDLFAPTGSLPPREVLDVATSQLFAGRPYRPQDSPSSFLFAWGSSQFSYLSSTFRDQLVFQVDVAPLLATLSLTLNAQGDLELDVSALLSDLRSSFASGADPAKLLEISQFFKRDGIGEAFSPIQEKLRQIALGENEAFAKYIMPLLADDWRRGDDGNNTLSVGDGLALGFGAPLLNTLLDGGPGRDTLLGKSGRDTLVGGAGDDILSGGGDVDVYVYGRNDGKDLIRSVLGTQSNREDILIFGSGISAADLRINSVDTQGSVSLSLSGTADQITLENMVPVSRNTQSFSPIGQFIFADGGRLSCEDILSIYFAGSPLDDDIRGSFTPDRLIGGLGRDSLSGGEGDDTLLGGLDHDVLAGGLGFDLVVGDEGDDTLSGGAGRDTLDGGPGADRLEGNGGDDLLLGGDGNDTFYYHLGISGRDTIYAGLGDDLFSAGNESQLFYGEAGNDKATGGMGSDTLDGGSGDDALAGEMGKDWLLPGPGRDTLTGGYDTDRFVFLQISDSGLDPATRDVITDFEVGDRIDLSAIDANDLFLGDQPFRFVGGSRFSGLGQLRYTIVNGQGLLEGNCSGRLDADFQITLLGAPALQSSSFIF